MVIVRRRRRHLLVIGVCRRARRKPRANCRPHIAHNARLVRYVAVDVLLPIIGCLLLLIVVVDAVHLVHTAHTQRIVTMCVVVC